MRYLNYWDNKNFWGAKFGPLTHASSVNYYRCSFQYPEVTKHINAKIPDVPVVSIFGTADKALSVD